MVQRKNRSRFEPSTVDVGNLPSAPLPRRLPLPDRPGIYFVTAPTGEVLYIGRAKSLRARWKGIHHQQSELDRVDGARLAWLTVNNADELSEIESLFIAYFSPRLNGMASKGSSKSVMVGTRVPKWVKGFYDRWAKAEERKPGFVLRKVLVEYASANATKK